MEMFWIWMMMVVVQPREKPLSSIKWWILCYVKCNSIAGRITFGENWSLVRDSLAGKRAENKLNEWEKSVPCGCVCVAGGTCYTEFKAFNTSSVEPRKKSTFRVMEPPPPQDTEAGIPFWSGCCPSAAARHRRPPCCTGAGWPSGMWMPSGPHAKKRAKS